jgi:hypothetical protein
VTHRSHLTVSSDPTFTARSRSTWEIVRRVSIYLKPYPWLALGTIACAILATLCSFAFPNLTRVIIDK